MITCPHYRMNAQSITADKLSSRDARDRNSRGLKVRKEQWGNCMGKTCTVLPALHSLLTRAFRALLRSTGSRLLWQEKKPFPAPHIWRGWKTVPKHTNDRICWTKSQLRSMVRYLANVPYNEQALNRGQGGSVGWAALHMFLLGTAWKSPLPQKVDLASRMPDKDFNKSQMI